MSKTQGLLVIKKLHLSPFCQYFLMIVFVHGKTLILLVYFDFPAHRDCLHLKHFLRDLHFSLLFVGQETQMTSLQLLQLSLLQHEILKASLKKTSPILLNLLRLQVSKLWCCSWIITCLALLCFRVPDSLVQLLQVILNVKKRTMNGLFCAYSHRLTKMAIWA